MPITLDVQIASNISTLPEVTQFQYWANSIQTNEETSACLRVVDVPEAKSLNFKYRQTDKATNVLSFPADLPSGIDIKFLGDVIICAPVVISEAKSQAKSVEDHWAHLLIHGLLHLQGYDHIKEQDAETMELLEVELLETLKISNPYK